MPYKHRVREKEWCFALCAVSVGSAPQWFRLVLRSQPEPNRSTITRLLGSLQNLGSAFALLRVLAVRPPWFAGRTRPFFWKGGFEGDKGRAGSAEPAAQNPGEDGFQEKTRDQSEKETGHKAGERHSKTPGGPANLSEGDGAEACQSNHPQAAPCEPGPHFRHSGRPPAQQAAQDRTQKPCAKRVPKRGSSRSRKSRENCRLTGRNAD